MRLAGRFAAQQSFAPRRRSAQCRGTLAVSQWEYQKIALNQLPRKTDDVDVLCEAGSRGWELVAILANNMAYLKRDVGDPISEMRPEASDAGTFGADNRQSRTDASAARTYEVKAKYRDPKTNETWSGRGRMASWLK